jgi:iron-sulfur cluster repair protein YtfE (RIC family)
MAKATRGKNPKATDLLKQQHRQVRDLFKRVEKTDDAGRRRRLLDEIASALKLHTALEEQVFYPAVREINAKAEEMIDEAFEEHHVVDLVLAELPDLDPEDERFQAKMTVLEELVDHHVREEEKEMFKLAGRLGDQALRELGLRMREQAGEADTGARAA